MEITNKAKKAIQWYETEKRTIEAMQTAKRKQINSLLEQGLQTTREIIDTETTEEPTYARIDPDFFDERYTIAEISDKYGIKKQMLHNAVTVTKKLIKDEDGKISMRNLTKWMLELRTTKKTPESDRVALFNSVYQTDFTERGQAAEYLTGSDFHIEKTKTKKKLD